MTIDLLRIFCGLDREKINKPFLFKNRSYATDGRICIVSDAEFDPIVYAIDELGFASRIDIQLADAKGGDWFKPSLGLPLVLKFAIFGYEDGEEWVSPKQTTVKIFSNYFDLMYLFKILNLPEVQFKNSQASKPTLYFRFTGGSGSLVGLDVRTEPPNVQVLNLEPV